MVGENGNLGLISCTMSDAQGNAYTQVVLGDASAGSGTTSVTFSSTASATGSDQVTCSYSSSVTLT